MPRSKMPSTIKRSPKKAQDTYEETLEHAEDEYGGDEARAHRVAYASLKHSFEKVGDRWEPKKKKGPSDDEAAEKGAPGSHKAKKTAGGVDVKGHTKEELYERAKKLDVKGRSRMSKSELGRAIARKQR